MNIFYCPHETGFNPQKLSQTPGYVTMATKEIQPPPTNDQAVFRQSPPAHSVANIDALADILDDISTLSGTDTGKAKAMRMLQQYFVA